MEEVELIAKKLGFVIHANTLDILNKERLLEELSTQLEELHTSLASLNIELEKAELNKKNNEVYHKMLRDIDQYRSCEETSKYGPTIILIMPFIADLFIVTLTATPSLLKIYRKRRNKLF